MKWRAAVSLSFSWFYILCPCSFNILAKFPKPFHGFTEPSSKSSKKNNEKTTPVIVP
jgi:hypothetical protein